MWVQVSILHTWNTELKFVQIHEMLLIEKGGPAQVAEELEAYNPLIPQGKELGTSNSALLCSFVLIYRKVATFMIEIDNRVRRERELKQLAGIDTSMSLSFGAHSIRAVVIGVFSMWLRAAVQYLVCVVGDDDRTRADGKTSAVHFLRFPFTDEQVRFISFDRYQETDVDLTGVLLL